MRREIDIGRALRHPHIVPVLDADSDLAWFVMPLAQGSADDDRQTLGASDSELRRLVTQICEGIDVAHDRGWIHRDVKPANILKWPDNTWAIGDWGLGRRPRGSTTVPRRTQMGIEYGTPGFAPPELGADAHEATAASDIFSIGQVIGWALTGADPRPNVPLLPGNGPWRRIVRRCTQLDPAGRPQSVAELLQLLAHEFDETFALDDAENLLALAKQGHHESLMRLWHVAAEHPADDSVILDLLPRLGRSSVGYATKADPEVVEEVLAMLREHVDGGTRTGYIWISPIARLILEVCRAATIENNLDLMESALVTLFVWDEHWDQWDPQKDVKDWIRTLRGEAAGTVASVLRDYSDTIRHLSELANETRVDRNWSGYGLAGSQGWPLASMTRTSKKCLPCFVAVER